MSFEAQKITGYASGIAALPDRVEGRAAWLKAQFDARTDNEVKTQHNALCDALSAPNAAAGLGAQAPAGIAANPAPAAGTAASVQAVLQGLAEHTDAHAARRDNPHGVTAAQLDAYTRAQTDGAIAARIVAIGAGDMAKTIYDPQGLGLPLLPKTGDGTQVTAVFTLAPQDADISSGETLGVLFGKIARRLAALADAMKGKAAASHTHDDRYYTETETNNLLAGKAASSHTHTKAQVGLGNVDNTADSAKSVKYATSAGSAVDQTARNSASSAATAASNAQTTANAAMPKSGGQFTGNVLAYNTNRSGWSIRNIIVQSNTWANVSTDYILMQRK